MFLTRKRKFLTKDFFLGGGGGGGRGDKKKKKKKPDPAEFRTHAALMYVIVTYKYKKDPIKNS